jgi:hypothetical protein
MGHYFVSLNPSFGCVVCSTTGWATCPSFQLPTFVWIRQDLVRFVDELEFVLQTSQADPSTILWNMIIGRKKKHKRKFKI